MVSSEYRVFIIGLDSMGMGGGWQDPVLQQNWKRMTLTWIRPNVVR